MDRQNHRLQVADFVSKGKITGPAARSALGLLSFACFEEARMAFEKP